MLQAVTHNTIASLFGKMGKKAFRRGDFAKNRVRAKGSQYDFGTDGLFGEAERDVG